MSVVLYLGTILLGGAVGLVGAALGVGGGIFMVPAFLEFVPGLDFHTAKGTSLLAIVLVAALNAWRLHDGEATPPWRLATTIAAGSMLGAYGSAWGTTYVSSQILTWGFTLLMGVVMLRLFFSNDRRVRDADVRENEWAALAIGLVAGVVSGSAGVGGGLIIVPLTLLAGLTTNERVSGLSNMVMVPTSAAAVLGHLQAPPIYTGLPGTIGQVCLPLAVLVFAGALFGSPIGKIINEHLSYRWRRLALTILLAVIILRLVWRSLAA